MVSRVSLESACAQVVFGVTAVIMPGTVLGDGAVLGAIAAADIGQELGSNALFMGMPAISTSQHQTGAHQLLSRMHSISWHVVLLATGLSLCCMIVWVG